jgi:ABC-type glycerol-3-phosphate transport system substrate-binding protein
MKKSMIGLGCAAALLALMLNGCSTSSSSADDADPIHQATTVLSTKYGDSVTYDEVKSVTDQALSATGNPVDDEYRGRAWSAVLKVIDGQAALASVDPMDVMRCASGGNAGSGVELSQVIALCAVSLK